MSRDTILTAPDGTRYSLDNLATQKWLDGYAPGATQVIGWIRQRAAELFENGKDAEAVAMRSLAERVTKELLPQIRQRALDHERDHPYIVAPEPAKARRRR